MCGLSLIYLRKITETKTKVSALFAYILYFSYSEWKVRTKTRITENCLKSREPAEEKKCDRKPIE